ncbi:hypothetical protein [Cohaesibacter gelatinilyticus]|nr:hypothetical protein [Cohaesibacter gelatinilyticus]
MRKIIFIALLIGVTLVVWNKTTQSSKTVVIDQTDYNLTFSVSWDWGMEERLSLNEKGGFWPLAESEWFEIYKKPYNSGAALYIDDRRKTIFIGTRYKLGILDLDEGTLSFTCDKSKIPALSNFGEQITTFGNREKDETLDPAAPSFPSYIEPKTLGDTIPVSPPPSKYYSVLQYLGMFGIVRGDGRGSEVGFAPADKAPEPRVALYVHCG